jgi:hypothetical protein
MNENQETLAAQQQLSPAPKKVWITPEIEKVEFLATSAGTAAAGFPDGPGTYQSGIV